MDGVAEIEEALVAQWSHFGRWPRGRLCDESGLLWFETPIKHLPYNGVIRTALPASDDADGAIRRVADGFRERGVQFFWIVHPSAEPPDLAVRLPGHGLRPVERMTGMSLELGEWDPAPLPAELAFEEVFDDASMRTYADLTMEYWEIPEAEQHLVREMHAHWGPGRAPGHRYLALAGKKPVGKGYLSLAGPPRVASIYGMSVLPEARGRGVASALTTTLLRRAKQRGCTRAVLHATEMAVGVYARKGFAAVCEIDVYATSALWSDDH